MKRVVVFFLLVICQLLNTNCLFAQNPGEWMWIHGDSAKNNPGNFGTLGVPSPSNEPPALYEACEWTDLNGNFWMYGGVWNARNDLWKYNPVGNEWTWMTGTLVLNDPGNYGTQGIPSPSNQPPGKGWGIASWVDKSGNLWMFGGAATAFYSDLWEYDIGTNEWTWMKGPNTTGQAGVFGTQGVPNITNNPTSREEAAVAWTDSAGDLWLFGGNDSSGNTSCNDLWRFNIATNTWTWMKGSQPNNQPGVYGSQGVEAPANTPGARWAHGRWKDQTGKLWFFGGYNVTNSYNDLWRYNPVTNNWAWMSGSSSPNAVGLYGTKCTTSPSNMPSTRMENRASWVDANGNFWMFGGYAPVLKGDLWMYCLKNNQWTWVSGDSTNFPAGNWGTKNVSSPTNKPGGRMGTPAWTDGRGHLFLFGGQNSAALYNDLWEYTIDPNCGTCPLSLPVANFISSDTAFCGEPGKCISFTDHSTGNPTSWHWIFTGANPDTSSQQNPTNICYFTPGTYPVTLIVTNPGGTDTLTVSPMITVGNTPSPPLITLNNDTLFSSPASQYQWFFNGSAIAGATDSFYTPVCTQAGTYAVQITDSNGCSILSNGFICEGINELSNIEFKIYPNPVGDKLVIDINRSSAINTTINIYDMLGEKIYSGTMVGGQATINCKPFPSGVYFIRITDVNNVWTGKIIVAK